MRRGAGLVLWLVVFLALVAPAAAAGPTPSGKLTVKGILRDGSTVTATGVTWTPVAGTVQSISYAWSACSTSCGATAIPTHQPYLPTLLLGPADAGKELRVIETATDVAADGTEFTGHVTFTTTTAVSRWPAGIAPRVDLIYGLPPAQTTSDQEQFDLSPAHANPADGAVRVMCSLDGRVPSTLCGQSHRFLTPILASGPHTLVVIASSGAGTRRTIDRWTVQSLPAPVACAACFHPRHLDSAGHPMSWDWQLQGKLVFRRVDMFDIDGFGNSGAAVAKIHGRAGLTLASEKAVCYISLGSWENFRPDQARWPAAALGLTLDGYLNEHWVDVRQLPSLMPTIVLRLRMCAQKGFDGVEVDNIDGWNNPSGFPLTPADAEAWLAAIANEAHAQGLFVLWKNDPDLASFGVRYFDGALSEQCFAYQECTAAQNDGTTFFPGWTCNTTTFPCGVQQFALAGKWVGEAEYKFGVAGEDGVVCDPEQSCALRASGGNFVEVPFSFFCSHVYDASGFDLSAVRLSESDQLDGTEVFPCW